MKRSAIKRTGFSRPVAEPGPTDTSGGRSPAKRGKRQSRPRAKPDATLAAWSREVKKRDRYKCQWPGCVFWHDQLTVYVAHHKALRSARPDLRLVLENGVTVCWDRHEFIHSEHGRNEAIAKGFLNLRTMELARSKGTLGVI